MNLPAGTEKPSGKSTGKSNEPETQTSQNPQLPKDILMLEDDIQRYHNRIDYDRSLTEKQRAELWLRIMRKTQELKQLKNQS
ncbi:hypothetical protein DN752_17975 [Echinicola strongylocentroti]|uniref:Uncharacterized protein n=1 Tax=Echinicola strongylocentroti TaxID=1795355 RepID=A0A2Z4IMA5_9BACT|nr:hypothetical protein [Echinicola strongylocentroti]AWW31869.1 hypothetical protein DN752_17975 [Echinicola strongylocentroti]